jgi:hypothetical protein
MGSKINCSEKAQRIYVQYIPNKKGNVSTCIDPRKSEIDYGDAQTKSSSTNPLPLKSSGHCAVLVWNFISSQKNITPAMHVMPVSNH